MIKQALISGAKSDEWYTPVEVVRTMLDVYPPKNGDRVLMPFDTDKSNFVKVITKEYDENAVYGITDFMTNTYDFDYLITNPPYSNKDEIIARCIENGKPCVLVLPIDALGGVQRHKLYSKTNISVYVPTKRIKFISENGEHKKTPANHSVIMMINAPKTEIIFEYQKEKIT